MRAVLDLGEMEWATVYRIAAGHVLEKGFRNPTAIGLRNAADSVDARYGCYCWRTREQVLYIGSFSPYRQHKGSSLRGRVSNYLGNHNVKKTGHENTNKMVFDAINRVLVTEDVEFAYLTFEAMQIGETRITFEQFSREAHFAKAVEELLICLYRLRGECSLNRS